MMFKRSFLSAVEGNGRMVTGVYIVSSLGGAMCISLLGMLLFIGSL